MLELVFERYIIHIYIFWL